ncbi:hypothetical protein [Kangiella geojedonensis]|uniref:Uncharacterized protein n=1 Tax=Kangiella geojedonensis TaxID=914150 RepID=A0A0F6TQ68_9GAMM|nr:hypothetical protein [Kangiella geojedonensis]AKE51922.1 hypothetical protein TQ33_0958 [Kangiella geojedonensis]
MSQKSNQDFEAKLLASKVMLNSAEISSTFADKFINWIVAGSGALLSVIFSTQTSLLTEQNSQLFMSSAYIYIFIVLPMTCLSKLLTSAIQGMAISATRMEAHMKNNNHIEDLDMNAFMKEVESSTLPGFKWFVARSFNKIRGGDIFSANRNIYRCAQLQTYLMVIILILAIVSIYKLLSII